MWSTCPEPKATAIATSRLPPDMNPVGELLPVEDIEVDSDVPDRDRLLERLAFLLARQSGLSEADILRSLRAREQLGSTGLGHGVALPHARMPQCHAAAAVFVRTRVPISFDAPDRLPVSKFLGLIVPNVAADRHLRILATAASMFGDRAFRDAVDSCRDPRGLAELFAAWPTTPEGTPAEASARAADGPQ
jgi:nitrogen PTS system EIIA component